MEEEDHQEPQEEEEIEWGENVCCFALASAIVVAAVVMGILSAYSITQESNVALHVLLLLASFIILISGVCWAMHYAKKGYNPGAIGPAVITRRPQGAENPIRLTGRGPHRRDVDVENPTRSQPPAPHTSGEHSSPNLESGEEATASESSTSEARKILKATVASALQKITESASSAYSNRPRLHAARSRAKRRCDIDVEKASTTNLTDPAVSDPSRLQTPELYVPGEHYSRDQETGETATRSETVQSERLSIPQASAGEPSGSGGSVSAEAAVVQSDIGAIRYRKFTPEPGQSSSDD